MKNQKFKKITIVFLISIIVFSVINPVFGAINESYNIGNPVDDTDIEAKIKDSVIIEAIAQFVNGIASMVENLVGKGLQGLTGSNQFPWADRILFNAIPMLDVNIFNPAEASLFKTKDAKYTPLAEIVRDTYFTILTIAVAFLTIVVGIAAVRLAISSIASEKARYKQALTNWVLAIVLLFLMHNLISFIFWTNEKIVEVASSIVKKGLEKGSLEILAEAKNIDSAEALGNFLEANHSITGFSDDDIDYIKKNSEVAYRLLSNEDYQESALSKAFADKTHTFRNGIRQFFNQNGSESISILKDDIEFIKNGKTTYTSSTFGNGNSNTSVGGTNMTTSSNTVTIQDLIDSLKKNDEQIKETKGYSFYNTHTINARTNDVSNKLVTYYKKYATVIISRYEYFHPENSSSNSQSQDSPPDLMATLGEYFKTTAYVIPTDEDTGEMTGWRRSKLSVQGALLYAIFVFQSLFYFFSYVKRFFYIVILVIMAPAIVVLDFLRKAIV